jgi:hypothetical protein
MMLSISWNNKFKQHKEVAKYPFDFYLPEFNLLIEYHGRQHKDGWLNDKTDAKAIQARDRIKKTSPLPTTLTFSELDQTNKDELCKALELELVRLS